MIKLKYSSRYDFFPINLKKIVLIIISIFLFAIVYNNNDKIIILNNFINNKNFHAKINYGLYFNVTYYQYLFSFNFNSVEVKYSINFRTQDNNSIIPSDLTLNYNLHIFCSIQKGSSININSLSTIKNNEFMCIEYFGLNEKIKIGIRIYDESTNIDRLIILMNNLNFDFNKYELINDDIFNKKIIINDYFSILNKISNENNYENKKELLKISYISYPYCLYKEKIIQTKNTWNFLNIYNNYFCSCLGNKCDYKSVDQICKFKLYLNIIDNNSNIYNKTHYLLADFVSKDIAPGDAYFLFKEMKRQNFPVYYLTERKDIYNECYNSNIDKNHQNVILKVNKQKIINGDFLEKYLDLFLKLKVVISGAEYYYLDNIFYNINYITFICLGHGVNYFKPFLYNDYYGKIRYNKIILPSNIIINISKKYGWEEDDIIKVGLPKWDIFDNFTHEINPFRHITIDINQKSIFMMFTWRGLNYDSEISNLYFNNINSIINDQALNLILQEKGIILYLSLHHNLINKRKYIKQKKNIICVKQEEILLYLYKSNLIISDFSSVIFDFIYQNKPYIIFIPDAHEPFLKDIYTKDYFDVINGMRNNAIFFENKYFSVDDTINKIIYYINNDFKVENKLKEFYRKLDLGYGKKNHISELMRNIIAF